MQLAADVLERAVDRSLARSRYQCPIVVGELPQPAQEAEGAFHAVVVPRQRFLRRAGEHNEKARGIGAVLFDQRLRVDAVVLRLGHGADAAGLQRPAVTLEYGGSAPPLPVE